MSHGLRVLREFESIPTDSMLAYGGIFRTPQIPQRLLAAVLSKYEPTGPME